MIIHDFDNQSESVIKVEDFYGKPKNLIQKCLILFSKEIHDFVLKNFECKEIAQIHACNGVTPIYSFLLDGEEIGFYLTGIGAPVASIMAYECHHITGANQFIMFGSCGSLDASKTKGKFILATECYRGEGTSYYFKEASDYLSVKNADKVASIFDECHIPYVKGRVWTTDCMLRETSNLVHKRKEEGCIAVDMELSGVQAMADFYGFELYNFLESGDVLEESSYDMKGLHNANHAIGKLYIPLEIAKRI